MLHVSILFGMANPRLSSTLNNLKKGSDKKTMTILWFSSNWESFIQSGESFADALSE